MDFEKYFMDKDIEEAKDVFKEIERKMIYLNAFLKDGDFSDAKQIVYEILEGIRLLSDLSAERRYAIQLLKTMEQMKSHGLKPMEVIRRYEAKQN